MIYYQPGCQWINPPTLGDAPCLHCGRPAYFAWDTAMEVVALEPDETGSVAVRLDGNRLPWCRPVGATQLALGEQLYRLHNPACTAPVIPITTAPSYPGHPADTRGRTTA